MVPTLAVDDRIVVEKVSSRFRSLERGDVIVFAGARREDAPERDDASTRERILHTLGTSLGLIPPDPSDLVKRLIGLPGDEVAVIDGSVHINGVAYREAYLSGPAAVDFGPVTVPEDALFFLGDNRRNSADSRGSLGFVERDRVIGRAVAVVWPLGNAASLLGQRLEAVPMEPAPAEVSPPGPSTSSDG